VIELKEIGPGQELDRLIGVRVMGWTLMTGPMYGWTWPLEKPTAFINGNPVWGMPIRGEGAWKPSTAIGHAWEVVERLSDNRVSVRIDNCTSKDTEREYCATIQRKGRQPYFAFGPLPLAICKAALMAMPRVRS
jgi:hypothetical protein